MKINDFDPVSPEKVRALSEKIRQLKINPQLIEETFARGGGKGGQNRQKTSNAVLLRYAPFKLVVRASRERHRNINRFLALRELVDEVDHRLNPQTASRIRDWAQIKKQKKRRQRRGKKSIFSSDLEV